MTITSPALTRRSLLGAGAVLTAGTLAGCGTPTAAPQQSASAVTDTSAQDKSLVVSNWALYIDTDEKGADPYPTVAAFEKESGLKVTYNEDIGDNEAFYAKLAPLLRTGQPPGRDLVVLTDWMAARMIRLGYTQKLDHAVIPNAANILPTLANVDFDPGRQHSLTWQSGFAGLAWDKSKVPAGLHSIDDLWKPELAGRVEVLSEMRDTIGLIMFSQGVDPAGDWSDDDFYTALEVLKEKIASGHIRKVLGNSYTQDLESGDAIAVIGWSGDITSLNY
jgi:spermidine/putrescine transport system substrate-binding protein